MAIFQRQEWTGTTSDTPKKPMQCHTCKQRKTGVFDVDANGRPRCFDCMPEREKAAYRQDEADG